MSRSSDKYRTPRVGISCVFRCRIVVLEQRLQCPIPDLDICFSEFSGCRVRRVPVISIFGSTEDARSVCVHIHKVFPYFYVPYSSEFPRSANQVEDFLRLFGQELESALNDGSGYSDVQRIFNLQLVFAKSVYGFQETEQIFIKIILFDPRDVPKAGKILQPFETHIPFFLQFKMDFNLFGMDMIELSDLHFRKAVPVSTPDRVDSWMSSSARETRQSGLSPTKSACGVSGRLPCVSQCEIEADTTSDKILNIRKIDWRSVEEVSEDVRLIQSLSGMWEMSNPAEKRPKILREVSGDLCPAISAIRQRIRDIQDSNRDSKSVYKFQSCSTERGTVDDRKSAVPAANALVDKQSICVSPSPFQEQDVSEKAFTEEQNFSIELNEDLGMLLELAEIAEEEQDLQNQDEEQEVHDIMACFEDSDEENPPVVETYPPTSQELAQVWSEIEIRKTDQQTEALLPESSQPIEKGIRIQPLKKPPCVEEMEDFLEECKIWSSNKEPSFGADFQGAWHSPLSQLASFSDRKQGWDKLKSKLPRFPESSEMSSRWTTCKAPPSVGEVSQWLEDKIAQREDERVEISDEMEVEKEYRERPDSPRYDESSSFFHTPHSLKALSFKKRKLQCSKRSEFENRSDMTGSSKSGISGRQWTGRKELNLPLHGGQQLVICCVEIHAASRDELLPDPQFDAVHCIVLTVTRDTTVHDLKTKVLLFHPAAEQIQHQWESLLGMESIRIQMFNAEKELMLKFIQEVVVMDPDILIGFDMVKASLGYLTERAFLMDIHLLNEISRMPVRQMNKGVESGAAGRSANVYFASSGRILLELWKILRSEIKLSIYSFENCISEVLKTRQPYIPQSTLHSWYSSSSPNEFDRCLRHYIHRSVHVMEMLEELDVVGRTGEMARLYGIDFYSVMSRGSQYRVESMLIRLAHSQNYLMLSPSAQQVYDQPAMECLPLVLEPQSRVHCDPVVVLDFQSLYPSLIIAYNLCFTTICCKNLPKPDQSFQLGVSNYKVPSCLLDGRVRSEDLIITPNGMSFLPPTIKKGILPHLLREILETRIMIKDQMKATDPANKILMRCLNARQFGLKMIANVSYGYTAAGFSGRMPMAELADSIVQSGRQTLMNAIQFIENTKQWNAEVVYGDSISEETPLLLRVYGKVLIRQSGQLGDRWEPYHHGKERCWLNGVESWTEEGWTPVVSVIRHQWNPEEPLWEVQTTVGSVCCTQDHSLLTEEGIEISPTGLTPANHLLCSLPTFSNKSIPGNAFEEDLARLMGISVSSWDQHLLKINKEIFTVAFSSDLCSLDKYCSLARCLFPFLDWSVITEDGAHGALVVLAGDSDGVKEFVEFWRIQTTNKLGEPRIPDFILNSSFRTRQAFWNGFQDGIKHQFNSCSALPCFKKYACLYLGLIVLEQSFSGPDIQKQRGKIIRATPVVSTSVYVYDLTTKNHHFHAGAGSLIVHNTDSVFVKLPGQTKQRAFEIGREIAEAVTRDNPTPIGLKMEKVYYPCVLLTKKHYVGFSYEKPDQKEPVFDAKGIETIRRDSCPAVAKILEKTLTLLFQTKDLTKVKEYLERQWGKILTGRVNLKDFIFSKEVRVGHYRSNILPPAAVVAAAAQKQDPRRSPQPGERIPYIVIYGHPGCRLVDLVIEPHALVESAGNLKLNSLYYIKKQINPALDRVLSLTGISVNNWFMTMPRSLRTLPGKRKNRTLTKEQNTIDNYFLSRQCQICDELTCGTQVFCPTCLTIPQKIIGVISTRLNRLQSELSNLETVCVHCLSHPRAEVCRSLDCRLYFDRIKLREELKLTDRLFDQINELF